MYETHISCEAEQFHDIKTSVSESIVTNCLL